MKKYYFLWSHFPIQRASHLILAISIILSLKKKAETPTTEATSSRGEYHVYGGCLQSRQDPDEAEILSVKEQRTSGSTFSNKLPTIHNPPQVLPKYPNMSREAYQVPTQAPPVGRGDQGTMGIDGPATNYLCGDCNSKVPIKRGDPIRCKECGHRVLYKERTKRWVSQAGDVLNWCADGIATGWCSSRRDNVITEDEETGMEGSAKNTTAI